MKTVRWCALREGALRLLLRGRGRGHRENIKVMLKNTVLARPRFSQAEVLCHLQHLRLQPLQLRLHLQ